MPHTKYAIEGILFDLDGTLMDTASDFVTVVHQMLSDDKLPLMDASIIRNNVSAGSRRLVELAYQLEPGTDDVEHHRNRLLDYYDRLIKQSDRSNPAKLYPGMHTLLDELDNKGIPWGIVTNKPEPYAHILVEQSQLMQRCHTLICPENVSQAKPSPESLLLASKQAKCSPEATVYVGDHERDIIAGKRAGMFTVTAHYGYITPREQPFSWQADLDIQNADELLPWLNTHHWQIPANR
ncbi:HAD family hydrolase [Endozoicomonas montiporae]|uniref:Phosphoglycolate phosphatase n=1 Tax=Endozoicomonas montiporae CL-33 TaxID=570277 RepID=A0A142BDG4_9GAMM|nr:HAD-IA family hydrolase [Endozoicomonas montiporae]AMO56790.1 phosphoglycolate phosphatase [Endozoicomonas montiporae CL-33]